MQVRILDVESRGRVVSLSTHVQYLYQSRCLKKAWPGKKVAKVNASKCPRSEYLNHNVFIVTVKNTIFLL